MADETIRDKLDRYKIFGLEPKAASLLIAYLEEGHVLTRAARKAKLTLAQAELIFEKPEFREALARHFKRAQARMEVTVENVVSELALIAFARPGKFLKIGAEGTPTPDFTDATEEDLAAISAVSYVEEQTQHGSRRSFNLRMHDKRAALVDLRKHLGGQFDAKTASDEEGLTIRIIGGLPPDEELEEAVAAEEAALPPEEAADEVS